MKIIRIKKHLAVTFKDGSFISRNDCTDEFYNKIAEAEKEDNEDEIKQLMTPEVFKLEKKIEIAKGLISNVKKSKIFSVFGNSVYIKSISELTVPEDLAFAIMEAEEKGDKDLIKTYKNFWTLVSQNIDSRVRTNLFWFLNKYGMVISRSGLFVAYRNVVLKEEGSEIKTELAAFISSSYAKVKGIFKQAPRRYSVGYDKNGKLTISRKEKKLTEILGKLDEMYKNLKVEKIAPTYTDQHTGETIIKIGQPVMIYRGDCDSIQENTCSSGLHVAGKGWLGKGSFGKIGMKVLVNPADVIAVPPSDDYGKMRTCAYYPIEIVEWKDGEIVDNGVKDGFEDNFMHMIAYGNDVNNEDDGNYSIKIPEIPEINRDKLIKRLKQISESLKNKVIED